MRIKFVLSRGFDTTQNELEKHSESLITPHQPSTTRRRYVARKYSRLNEMHPLIARMLVGKAIRKNETNTRVTIYIFIHFRKWKTKLLDCKSSRNSLVRKLRFLFYSYFFLTKMIQISNPLRRASNRYVYCDTKSKRKTSWKFECDSFHCDRNLFKNEWTMKQFH